MADFPSLSIQQRTTQNQKMTQSQTQRLSQQQLLSVKMLAMGSEDLRREIYDAVSKNPALIITKDKETEGIKSATKKLNNPDNIKLRSATQAGIIASDNFQEALESAPDNSETLAEHLERQFLSVNHTPSEEKLGLALIYNLDSKGFHILSPINLIDEKDSTQTPELLEKMIGIINELEPVGTCCNNIEESLYIQAKIRGDGPDEALFILNGHFEFLNPPQPAKIAKKIKTYTWYTADELILRDQLDFSEENIEEVLKYIRSLDPFPARNFSPSSNSYIEPDVYVEKDPETGNYSVRVNDEILPVVEVSRDFQKLSENRERVTKSTEESEKKRSEHRFIMDSVRSANDFLNAIEFRQRTLLLACSEIVAVQKDFFEKGQKFLRPLRQKDIAEKIGVHEATISRMAREKYLKCDAGIFPVNFFFTNAAGGTPLESGTEKEKTADEIPSTQEGIKFEIQKLLEEHKTDKKPLSDQKIADILAGQGIKIARRTVAKYRSALNIDSSYGR